MWEAVAGGVWGRAIDEGEIGRGARRGVCQLFRCKPQRDCLAGCCTVFCDPGGVMFANSDRGRLAHQRPLEVRPSIHFPVVCHRELTVLAALADCRPVAEALVAPLLLKTCDHGDNARLVLVDHAPKVTDRLLQWPAIERKSVEGMRWCGEHSGKNSKLTCSPLSRNAWQRRVVHLHVVGVYVVAFKLGIALDET